MSDQIPQLEPQSTQEWKQTAKDVTAGAAGGVAQVLIGQPFDLVKVRLQTQQAGNAWSAARQIWAHEGPLAFYKGTLMPLLGVGACVSISFGALHTFRQVLESHNRHTRPSHDPTLSLPQFYVAGAGAGLVTSIVSGPVEHIRIRLQTQSHGAGRIYMGPFDCAWKLMRAGGLAGLYRGQVMTVAREMHGYGVWFATYEGLMRWAMHRQGKRREELPGWQIAVYGGLAGEALWLLTHPIDVIKSKMQSDGFGPQRKYHGVGQAVRDTWAVSGLRGMFHGIGPALLRAMPASAGTFVAAEVVRNMLN
ncbi:mitochondrial carrier protein [Aspergillus saccharolyticus JOP 1030-1]|uniref:Mitochondrial carrier protein n=1 Tax=Aspergillus saccharolyticus JOP 1030-1 TaxID=1450539 RepID=A0A318ZLZ8_9EURO|nr:mitochondrial carrier protein [Aspergillus saccharolyticus JOP 1030-1]PYH48631.1 mitochondrial carrier protein [Aspergillus saccharolyticus JOP 1030-1]